MSNTDPERLARLRRRASHCTTHHEACDCRELAHAEAEAEVARLNAEARRMTALHARTVEELDAARAEGARLRAVAEAGRTEVLHQVDRANRAMEIVCAVAGMEIVHSAHRCPGCQRPIHYTSDPAQDTIDHALECPFVQARALLAGADDGAGATPSVASDIAAGTLSGGASLTDLIRADRDGTADEGAGEDESEGSAEG